MEHRKVVHPSRRKCRNFPASCTHGNKCWYVHNEPEPMEIDETVDAKDTRSWNFKCNVCGYEFLERNDFMEHKRSNHPEINLTCQNFLKGVCQRSDESCWFIHRSEPKKPEAGTKNKKSESKSQAPVFQEVPADPFPPNQLTAVLKMVASLCQKVENMEKVIQEMKN